MARWKLFIWQGVALLVIAAVASAVASALAVVVGALGVLLLLAGLIGAASAS